MATVKFVLQKPYKERKSHLKTSDASSGESVLNGSKNSTKFKRQLNPLETRLYACLIIGRGQVVKIKSEHVVYPVHWDFTRQLKKENIAGSHGVQ